MKETQSRRQAVAGVASRCSRWLLAGAISFVYLLLCNRYSTPLVGTTGIDYDMFLMGGAFFNRGELYLSFFDNKGPYLFFINGLGLLLDGGKWGVFLLEVINLAVTLRLLMAILRNLGAGRNIALASLGIMLLLLAGVLRYGDSVEMWSLPWALLPLWLMSRRSRGAVVPFFAGVAIGIIAMLRLNDAAIPATVALISVLSARSARLKYLVSALAGIVAGIAPALVWSLSAGCFREMIDTAFIYNFRYWVYQTEPGLRPWLVKIALLWSCVVLVPLAWRVWRQSRREMAWVLIWASVFTFLSIARSRVLAHYFIMCMPIVAIAISALPRVGSRRLSVLTTLAIAAPYLVVYGADYRLLAVRAAGRVASAEARDSLLNYDRRIRSRVLEKIPAAQRSDVYQYELPMKYWGLLYHAGSLPVGKYTSQQEMIVAIDSGRRADIVTSFDRAAPRWVISGAPLGRGVLAAKAGQYEPVDTVAVLYGDTILVYRRQAGVGGK